MTNEAKAIIKNEWLQVFTLIITVSGFFLWARSESKEDYRHMEYRIDTHLQAIQNEMKDFHSKLIRLEEKYLQMKIEK